MVMDREASSWALQHVQEAINEVRSEYLRPSVLFKPGLRKNGPLWVAGYGKLEALGNSPDHAMREFDRMWLGRS